MAPRRDLAKRVLDLVIAVPVGLATLPVQAVVALAVRATLGRPILFRQKRPGLHGEPFELIKFRTMLHAVGERDPADDAARLTPFGAWLRATSLDELPTLWNVIRGDMSLVGPRPLLMSYLSRYSPEQARRHEVRPGITGLAQVSGRNELSWKEKFRLDVLYVDEHTTIGDLGILARTVRSVFKREGIRASGAATAHEFQGVRADGAGE